MISSIYRAVVSFFLSLEFRSKTSPKKDLLSDFLSARLRRFPFWAEGHYQYARLAFELGKIAECQASCQAALLLKIRSPLINQVEKLLEQCRTLGAKN